ncbi:MAG TPA: helix-turn-helix domain-containing protein [Candidatus Baltobacteraceae bacterium]|nr:helix-turn-helix domain-containing protein [Candidatus Baltobacteraceae bacterium]
MLPAQNPRKSTLDDLNKTLDAIDALQVARWKWTPPVVEPIKPAPEFFTSIKAAAAYIGVTPRTILNWKKSEWLKVEQKGKKIRIAKVDLEKCKSRQ